MAASREHRAMQSIWLNMLARCYNEKAGSYRWYGARGIAVCDRWRTSLDAFIADMGPRPSLGHSVDRKNSDLGYSPENCRWATAKEQIHNSKATRRVEWKGEQRVLVEVGREHGVRPNTVNCRLVRGWDPIKAATTPTNGETPMRFVVFRGESRRVSELATEFCVPKSRLFRRLDAGWSIEEALFSPSRNRRAS